MKKTFNNIQILRAAAASMVVVHHFYKAYTGNSTGFSLWHTTGLGELGQAGVDIFFAISGFIMFYNQLANAQEPTASSISLHRGWNFLKKRIVRIYPLYWFWTTVLIIFWQSKLIFAAKPFSTVYIFMSYLLVPWPNYNGSIHPFLDQGWTLALEMYFYIVFSITLFWGKGIKNVWTMMFIFALNVVVVQAFIQQPILLQTICNPLIVEFLFGGFIAIVVLKWKTTFTVSHFRWLLFVSSTILLAASQIPFQEATRFLVYGIPASGIVFSAAMIDRLSKETTTSYWTHLGNASYTIYLTHGFFSLTFGFLIKKGFFQYLNADLLILIGALLTIIISARFYKWVELPITKLIKL